MESVSGESWRSDTLVVRPEETHILRMTQYRTRNMRHRYHLSLVGTTGRERGVLALRIGAVDEARPAKLAREVEFGATFS